MEDYFTIKPDDKESFIFYSEDYKYDFISDNQIEVKDMDGKYFNTIKLQ